MGNIATTELVPLVEGLDGLLRVGGTRVTLDTVLAAFKDGGTAEEIVQQYPSLSLADVYQVIGYYLHHAAELEIYLAKRQKAGEAAKAMNEDNWPSHGIRDRLLSRRHS